MKHFFIISILLCILSISAQELNMKELKQIVTSAQDTHKSLLDSKLVGESSSFILSVKGSMTDGGLLTTTVPWTIFQNGKSFSGRWQDGGKTIQFYGDLKGALVNITWKFQEKKLIREFSCSILSAQNDFSIRVGKALEFPDSIILPVILKQAEKLQEALSKQNPCQELAEIAINIATILDIHINNSNRAVVNIHGAFSVSAPNSKSYGNGKAIQFHLLIKSGSGTLRHEIIGGYLFLTAILGSWSGEYWVWQEE